MLDTVSRRDSEETRSRILEATWNLLSSADSAVRMADVAKAAGVSRQAVYLHYPSRAELLIATTRHIDEVEDVAGQLNAVFANADGRSQLRAFVLAWGNYIPIVQGGAKRLMAIRDVDPDAAAAWEDRMTGLYNAARAVVETLHRDGELAEDLSVDEAADLLWATVSVPTWEALTVSRGMTQDRYLEVTLRSLTRQLVDGR